MGKRKGLWGGRQEGEADALVTSPSFDPDPLGVDQQPEPTPFTPPMAPPPAVQSELGRLQAQVSSRKLLLADLDRKLETRGAELARMEKSANERLQSLLVRGKEAETALKEANTELNAANKGVTAADALHRKYADRMAAMNAKVEEAEARLAEVQAQTDAEAGAETRLSTLQETLGQHEKAVDEHVSGIEAARAELARLHAEIAATQEAHARRTAAAQEQDDRHLAEAATLTHNKQILEEYAEALEKREQALAEGETALTLAQNDVKMAFDKIRSDRQELTAEETRLNQMRQALTVVEEEAAKTHKEGQGVLATAIQARAAAAARDEALTKREAQTEAGWLGVRNAERGIEGRIADLDARERRLRDVSLKLAGSAADLKRAIAQQKLEGAGITVPEVEA